MTTLEGLYLVGIAFSLIYGISMIWEYRNVKGWLPLLFNIVMASLFSWLGLFILYQVQERIKKDNK